MFPCFPGLRYCDAFVERDNLYIVMEFAERGDIHHKIKVRHVAYTV